MLLDYSQERKYHYSEQGHSHRKSRQTFSSNMYKTHISSEEFHLNV